MLEIGHIPILTLNKYARRDSNQQKWFIRFLYFAGMVNQYHNFLFVGVYRKSYITIPKSSKPERIQQNANVFYFSISKDDMKTLVGVSASYL